MITSTKDKAMTTQEVAARFHELAQQEKWFEIQDELFSDNVRSVDPPNSPYEFPMAVHFLRRPSRILWHFCVPLIAFVSGSLGQQQQEKLLVIPISERCAPPTTTPYLIV